MTTTRERRAALRARRDAVSARLQRRRRPLGRRERRPWLLLALLLALVVLAAICCCGPPPAPVAPQPMAPASAPEGVSEPTPAPAPSPGGRIPSRLRPAFSPPPADALPWLPGFRLQVAARGPRLSACFTGAERPGTLRWTAQVEPVSGRVSDHDFESTLSSDPLTAAQRACLVAALTDPPYRIEASPESPPARVSVAIGF